MEAKLGFALGNLLGYTFPFELKNNINHGNLVISSLNMQSVKDFFIWWGEGLAMLLPGDKNISLSRNKESLALIINQNEYQVLNNDGDSLLHINHSIVGEIEALEDLFKNEVSKDGLALDIQINNSEVLNRKITLPANTEENLYEVIQYEMDRYTPFTKDEVYFDYRVDERIKEKQLIKVLLVVVRKEVLDPVINAIENSDVHLQNIDIDHPENNIKNVNLLRSHGDIGKSKNSSIKGLLVASASLLLLTAVTPLVINYIHIQRLSSELKDLEPTVQKVKQLQSEYTKMQGQVGYLVNIKENNPSIVEMLNILTQVIPDHTHVQRLSLEGGLLSIQGSSASASELIPVIDATGMFDDIRFAAPVTQSGGDGLERYSITAQIKRHKKT